jgi:EpsI family protein
MKILCYVGPGGHSLLQRLDLKLPSYDHTPAFTKEPKAALAIVAGLISVAAIASLAVSNGSEQNVARAMFADFPRKFDAWQAVDAPVDNESLEALSPSDYLSLNYFQDGNDNVVNVWSTYYSSQKTGWAVHPPRLCIPGGGWSIESLETLTLQAPGYNDGKPFEANRLLIKKEGEQSMVYYWFAGRGRAEGDEYAVKFHLMLDAITKHRTDGALVRLVTQVSTGESDAIAKADQRLISFFGAFSGGLDAFIPN